MIRKICTNKFDDPFYSWSVVHTDDDNELFLKSTFTSKRGKPYGLGSLEDTLVNEKRKYAECSSSAFLDLQQQLAEAHRKIQKQAAYNSKLKRQQNKHTKHFSIMEKFFLQIILCMWNSKLLIKMKKKMMKKKKKKMMMMKMVKMLIRFLL
ncbi:hypothetical protein Bca52824_074151 [Brassica carinata]|uniref:Uncharacterized protein n=1 Tax=Brassica carinata TaxID=52824 RepID=A0A8X7QCZ0_BRACI|nr:hypothetical protein Bca52824_074151 [Brassica carinata]